MSGIKVTWNIGSLSPEKHYIYRSNAPISPNNLPTPIAEVGQGISEYNDLTIVDGETYHYLVAADKMGLVVPAVSSVSADAFISNGPGSQSLIYGNEAEGFYGEVQSSNLFTGDELASFVNLTDGISVNSDSPWMKFILDGNVLYASKLPLRGTLSWNSIYNAGLVFGVDGIGFPRSPTDTNQLTTISKNGFTYKVRLLKCGNSQPWATTVGGEWVRTFGQAAINLGYVYNDFIGNGVTSTFGQEGRSSDDTRIRVTGINSVFFNSGGGVGASIGWRPVLELVENV